MISGAASSLPHRSHATASRGAAEAMGHDATATPCTLPIRAYAYRHHRSGRSRTPRAVTTVVGAVAVPAAIAGADHRGCSTGADRGPRAGDVVGGAGVDARHGLA